MSLQASMATPTSAVVRDPAPSATAPDRITVAAARLEAWLETMRGPGGYGGPVVHWWQQSLLYTGPGLDWRYEGIITGYVTLWQRTGNPQWLRKACRAGDDLLAGQLENGHYAASCFELNPASAGTPHEAACDAGLLLLAKALKSEVSNQRSEDRRQPANGTELHSHALSADTLPDWRRYADCAERNLQAFYVDRLWDAAAGAFRDDPGTPSFVPNKAATACEALFLLAEVRQDDRWVTQYALSTLDRIVEHQVQDHGPLDGAIAQNTIGRRRIDKYFPKYIARCVPALVTGYRWTGNGRYADAAQRSVQFLSRQAQADGSLPTVLYPGGRSNRYPSWIAPLADVLWAAEALRDLGPAPEFAATSARLLAGQDASGGIQTASGFAAQAGGQPGNLPDVRDVLHVAGWCDKAFRYLASAVQHDPPVKIDNGTFETPCRFQGQSMRYVETASLVEITSRGQVRYRWQKGAAWPDIATPEFWLH